MKTKKNEFQRFPHKETIEIENVIYPRPKVLKSDGLFSTLVEDKPKFQDFRDYTLENQLKAGIPLERVSGSPEPSLSEVDTILETIEKSSK